MGKNFVKALKYFVFLFSFTSFGSELKEVKIGSVVPLDMSDTEYSERYRVGYQGSLFFVAGEVNEKIKQCGYKFSFDFKYYTERDKSKAIEYAHQLEQDNTWIVLGPSRSDHFLVLAKSLKETMAISSLASSQEVMNLNSPFFSMYPTNLELASALSKEVKNNKYGEKYGSIIDNGCLNCRNFNKEFVSKFGKPIFQLNVDPDNLNLEEIVKKIRQHEINFLLLPNYSKLSGTIISVVGNQFKHLKFAGADGWGDGTYGYLTKIPMPSHSKGLAVRLGGRSVQIAKEMGVHSLSFKWKGGELFPASSSLLILEHIRKISNILCQQKPKNKMDFIRFVKSKDNRYFKSKLPISVYKMSSGRLKFAYNS